MLSPHAIARTLIAAVGTGLTSDLTTNVIVGGAAGAAVSGVLNELLSVDEANFELAISLKKAANSLSKEL